MYWGYPTFIAPIFNKFKPLDNDSLKQGIEKLLTQCGFQSKGVFVMDGSKRSAHSNAYFGNEASGPVFKIENDPRITKIGSFMRRTSLDELPQFMNIFLGDMSLVGPRPLPVRDYEGFSEDWHRRRFSVRPGLTCLWQIQGRSRVTFERWMELDMQYIDEWSFWLDMEILAKTVPVVIKGTGAS